MTSGDWFVLGIWIGGAAGILGVLFGQWLSDRRFR
jgi:hypothetical protein